MLAIFFILGFILWIFHNHGIPIFLYHQVRPNSSVEPELFESHLEWLQKEGYQTMTMSEYLEEGASTKTVLLTLDDGYYDNYKYVFPLLKKYKMKATIFLNTFYIHERREEEPVLQSNVQANYEAMKQFVETGSAKSFQYMTWEEIREMYESGLVDFQAHSHKHAASFMDTQLEGFLSGEEKDSTDVYLYGKIEEGYPKFRKRGEYSQRGTVVAQDFFSKFQEEYHKKWKKIEDEKLKLGKAQAYIDEHGEYFQPLSLEDWSKRIEADFLENKKEIEEHLGNEVHTFCWPWGHRSKEAIPILESLGVYAFVTTKKGTNDQLVNRHFIRRIELRNYSLQKFKWNVRLASNLILGKLYGIFS